MRSSRYRRVLYRPDQKRYGVAIYTDNFLYAMAMGVESALSATAASFGTTPPTRWTASPIEAGGRRACHVQGTLQVHASGLGKTFFVEDNRRSPAADRDEHELLRLFRRCEQATTQAAGTAFFANPAGPNGHALRPSRPGHLGPCPIQEPEASMSSGMVHQDETQKKWAALGRLHLQPGVLKSAGIPERHALQQGVLRTDVHGQGLSGRAEYAGARPASTRTSIRSWWAARAPLRKH